MLPAILVELRQERIDADRELAARWGTAFDLYDACFRAAFFTARNKRR